MVESLASPAERLIAPDPFFFRPPFCYPLQRIETGEAIVRNFAPANWTNAIWLADAMQHAYKFTKWQKPRPANEPPGVDLTTPYSVSSMATHLFSHAVTGDPRHGASTTRVTPVWDRELFIAGMRHVVSDRQECDRQIGLVDALCINALRTLSHYYVGRITSPALPNPREHEENAMRIEMAIQRGNVSKENPIKEQLIALYVAKRALAGDVDVKAIGVMDRMHAIAKMKQLLWLVDQQSESVRGSLVHELVTLAEDAVSAGITEDELAFDMGVDTGISDVTHRPAYVIKGFPQLRHLGQDTYALPQSMCERITIDDLLLSIDRPGNGQARSYDKRYRLPVRFAGRQAGRGATSFSVQQ